MKVFTISLPPVSQREGLNFLWILFWGKSKTFFMHFEVYFRIYKFLVPAIIYVFKFNNRKNKKKLWNMFKVNNKNTRTTLSTSYDFNLNRHRFKNFYCSLQPLSWRRCREENYVSMKIIMEEKQLRKWNKNDKVLQSQLV